MDQNCFATAPADARASNGAKLSTGAMLTEELHMFTSKFSSGPFY